MTEIRSGLILIVDDDRLMAKGMRTILELSGWQAAVAENGEVAVRVARELRPALILMNWRMPVMDGITATAHIRQCAATATIPVVLYSGYCPQEQLQIAYRVGIQQYVEMPISAHQLIEIVQYYTGIRH